LIEGQHFFPDVDPFLLGHKALAVNLSDLGAMGAKPRACLLALSMPEVRPEWLAAFSKGLFELADQAQCPLIGGDTTRSKQGVVISITVLGEVPVGQALQRSAAQAGDDIWLTGTLGRQTLPCASCKVDWLRTRIVWLPAAQPWNNPGRLTAWAMPWQVWLMLPLMCLMAWFKTWAISPKPANVPPIWIGTPCRWILP